MDRLLRQITQWWHNADKTTRIVSIVGSLLFIAVIFLTLTLSSQPKMQPVATGMSETDKSTVYDELTKKGFHVELSPQGDVMVPTKDYHRAQMDLAASNKLPKAGGSGFGLDKVGVFDTPTVEQEKLLKARETDLAESIDTMDGVASATVHVAPGKDAAVMDEKVAPTAVVSLTENTPGSVSKEGGRAIADLVQSAVTNLQTKGVKVITNSGHILFDGSEQDDDSMASNAKLETERTQGKTLTDQLQTELDTVFGHGAAIADVKVAYDMNPMTVVKHDALPSKNPLMTQKGSELLNGGGTSSVGGVAGIESNNPANPATPVTNTTDDGKKYNGTSLNNQYALSTTDTKEVKAATLVGETISVIVDKNKVKSVADLTKFVQGKLGANLGADGFTASVTQTEFNTTDADLAKKATDDASGQQRMQMILGLLPILALIGVGFLLSKSLPKLIPASTRALEANGGGAAALPDPFGGAFAAGGRNPQQIHQYADYSNMAGYMAGSHEPQVIEHRYSFDPVTGAMTAGGVSVAEAAAAAIIESEEERDARQTEEVMKALGIDEAGDGEIDIELIKQKINVPLERIKRMAEKKPELTAMLIKSWMMDDHR